jgi:hypothetical protein
MPLLAKSRREAIARRETHVLAVTSQDFCRKKTIHQNQLNMSGKETAEKRLFDKT